MKKLLVLFALLTGCGSTPPPQNPAPPLPVAPAPTTQSIKGDDWSITLPTAYTVGREPLLTPAGVSVKVFVDREDTRLVAITRMDNATSRMPGAMFLGKFIEYMTQDGTTVGETHEMLINGKPFSKVEFTKRTVKFLVFIHQELGVAHIVQCGGLIADPQLDTACSDIALTFNTN